MSKEALASSTRVLSSTAAAASGLIRLRFLPFFLACLLFAVTAALWCWWQMDSRRRQEDFRKEISSLLATPSESLRPERYPAVVTAAANLGFADRKFSCDLDHSQDRACQNLELARDIFLQAVHAFEYPSNGNSNLCQHLTANIATALQKAGIGMSGDNFFAHCKAYQWGHNERLGERWSKDATRRCSDDTISPPDDMAGCDCDPHPADGKGTLLIPSRLAQLDGRNASPMRGKSSCPAEKGRERQSETASYYYPERIRRAAVFSRMLDEPMMAIANAIEAEHPRVSQARDRPAAVPMFFFASIDGLLRFWPVDHATMRGTYWLHRKYNPQLAGRSYVLEFQSQPSLSYYVTEPYLDFSGAGLVRTECRPWWDPANRQALLGVLCADYTLPIKDISKMVFSSEYVQYVEILVTPRSGGWKITPRGGPREPPLEDGLRFRLESELRARLSG